MRKANKLLEKNVSDSIEIAENARNNSAQSVDSADKSQKARPQFKYRVVEKIAGASILRAIKMDFSASPLEALPTQISDISLQKAKKLPDNFEVNLPKSQQPYDASNFDDNTALFSDKTQPGEIHVNFGERLNYGGRVLQGIAKEERTYDEQKTLSSSTSLALASLQQSTYNKKRRKFLDFTLGKPGAMAGRPILIKGQRFFSPTRDHPGVEIAELDMALPEADVNFGSNLEQAQLRQAQYFFATAYNGFKMCKGNNQQSPVIRSGVQKNSTLSIHMQLAMQILAAQCAGVQLKLTSRFLEHEDYATEFQDFKNRILPQINVQLQNNTFIENKIEAIKLILQSVQLTQSGNVGRKMSSLVEETSFFGPISQILSQPLPASVVGPEVTVGETSLYDPLPQPQQLPSSHPASRSSTTGNNLNRSTRQPLPPSIHNITVPKYYLNRASSQKRQEIYAEITKPQIPQANSRPSETLIPTIMVPLITMTRIQEVKTLKEVQDKIQQVITKTVARLSAQDPNIRKKIDILMKSLAEYGLKHLRDVKGNSIPSILNGGEDAGFTNWRKKGDFRTLLSEIAEAEGLGKLDFSDENSPGTKYFAALSSHLQESSKEIFSTLNNKHYASGENKARTWRMAMIQNIKSLEPPQRSR